MEKILKEIKGIFDGEKMVVSDNCSILVPGNYASKSMLIAGTELVYRVTDTMSYFKQASVPPARTGIGTVIKVGDGLRVEVNNDGFMHRMLFLKASETFHDLKAGDEVVVVYPDQLSLLADNWCAIESKIS